MIKYEDIKIEIIKNGGFSYIGDYKLDDTYYYVDITHAPTNISVKYKTTILNAFNDHTIAIKAIFLLNEKVETAKEDKKKEIEEIAFQVAKVLKETL